MSTNLRLYDALKDKLGTDTAMMLADAIPSGNEIATKADLKAELAGMEARLKGWMLAFFVPIWIATWGTLVAILVKV